MKKNRLGIVTSVFVIFSVTGYGAGNYSNLSGATNPGGGQAGNIVTFTPPPPSVKTAAKPSDDRGNRKRRKKNQG